MTRAHNLINRRFGKLFVISRAENTKSGQTRWQCRCDCGGEKTTTASRLLAKKDPTLSCGCLSKDVNQLRADCHLR